MAMVIAIEIIIDLISPTGFFELFIIMTFLYTKMGIGMVNLFTHIIA